MMKARLYSMYFNLQVRGMMLVIKLKKLTTWRMLTVIIFGRKINLTETLGSLLRAIWKPILSYHSKTLIIKNLGMHLTPVGTAYSMFDYLWLHNIWYLME